MLVKPKTTGPGKVVQFKRRQVRRNPRRPLEAVEQDFKRWDAAAAVEGLNWSEFARRALADRAAGVLGFGRRPLSEKGGSKNGSSSSAKATGTRAGRKG